VVCVGAACRFEHVRFNGSVLIVGGGGVSLENCIFTYSEHVVGIFVTGTTSNVSITDCRLTGGSVGISVQADALCTIAKLRIDDTVNSMVQCVGGKLSITKSVIGGKWRLQTYNECIGVDLRGGQVDMHRVDIRSMQIGVRVRLHAQARLDDCCIGGVCSSYKGCDV
jgi:hypothetical protein